jgi:hypothetical protein
MHGASKCLWPRSLKTEDASLSIVTSTLTRGACTMLGLRILAPPPLDVPDDAPGVLDAGPNDSTGDGPEPKPVRMLCLPRGGGGSRGYFLPAGLRAAQAQDRDLSPVLEGALRLLRGSDTEDVLELVVHPVHPASGGCG